MTDHTDLPSRTGPRQWLTSSPALVVGLWLLWSSAFVAIKLGLEVASPDVFTLLRVVAALLTLLVAVAIRGGMRLPADARLHGYCAGLAATTVVGFLVFQNLGLDDAPVGVGSVLIYTQPFLVALGASYFRGERLSLTQVLGMVVGWLGVVLVVAGEIDVGATPVHAVVFLLLSATSWAIGTIVFTSLPATVPVVDLLLVINAYGALPIAVLVTLGSGDAQWGAKLVLTAIWAGAGASIGGLGLQFLLLRRGKAGVVSSWTFAVPVLAAALGVLFLDESAHLTLLLGGMAVAAGIYLVNSRRKRPLDA
jgi:drug/metabolite transporter (DMT)-like permease